MVGLRVFICHASEDKPRVRELCARLRESGFDPWMDEERLLPGQDWELEIAEAVRTSDVVVVCLSAASSVKVGYVQKELRRVLDVADQQPEGRIFVIPVRLEPCALPARLRQWHYADLFLDGGYERLQEALQSRAGEDRTGPGVANSELQPPVIPTNRGRRSFTKSTIVKLTILLIGTGIAIFISYDQVRITPPTPGKETEEAVPAGMVRIRGGAFLMGRNGTFDPEAAPAHEVVIKTFDIDKTPVTNARFREFLRSSNRPLPARLRDLPPAQDAWPVTEVTWDDAYAYCLAQGKRLPAEREWEYAARGTDGRLYPWGETFDAAAVNSRESGIGHPEPVGARAANRSPFDVADMSGNIWQWCADDYRPYPGRNPGFNIPSGAKAIRGGSFRSDAQQVAAITRNLELPSTRSPVIGFRCAK